MVFDGPWRRRRQYPNDPPPRGYGPYGQPGYPPEYDPRYQQPRGYRSGGFGGGQGSCLRDLLFLDAGCCLAESFGCGPNLLLVAPSAVRLGHTSDGRGMRARLLALIAAYQRDISPRRPARCRYTPTCSHYAADALQTHGLWRGVWLTTRRLIRCRPGAAGGTDPVPPVRR